MWQFMNAPDNFDRDWYGELTNQCGHTLIGVLAAITFCDVWFLIAGEMPVRSWTFLAVFLPYAIGIETIIQRWAPGDSGFDSLMFGLGAAGVLLPFYEVSQAGLVSTVEYTPRRGRTSWSHGPSSCSCVSSADMTRKSVNLDTRLSVAE